MSWLDNYQKAVEPDRSSVDKNVGRWVCFGRENGATCVGQIESIRGYDDTRLQYVLSGSMVLQGTGGEWKKDHSPRVFSVKAVTQADIFTDLSEVGLNQIDLDGLMEMAVLEHDKDREQRVETILRDAKLGQGARNFIHAAPQEEILKEMGKRLDS